MRHEYEILRSNCNSCISFGSVCVDGSLWRQFFGHDNTSTSGNAIHIGDSQQRHYWIAAAIQCDGK
jgi:hypothetical protein